MRRAVEVAFLVGKDDSQRHGDQVVVCRIDLTAAYHQYSLMTLCFVGKLAVWRLLRLLRRLLRHSTNWFEAVEGAAVEEMVKCTSYGQHLGLLQMRASAVANRLVPGTKASVFVAAEEESLHNLVVAPCRSGPVEPVEMMLVATSCHSSQSQPS